MTDYQKQQIIELFPTLSGAEIGRRIGLSRNYVNAFAKRMGVEHTSEAWQRIKHDRAAASVAGHTKESYKKAASKRRRTYKREMFRLLSGEKKETNIIISVLSHKCRRRMIMLCNMYNYFRDPDINEAMVYYDSETRRNSTAEQFATTKYGIKFIQADE